MVRDVLLFDVNETLLDLGALDGAFEGVFGDARVRREWFGQVLQSALVSVATGVHRDFATIGRAALDMVAARHGLDLRPERRDEVVAGMRSLPPHPEVHRALEQLRDAGYRMATLTNSPPQVVAAQLDHADLAGFFEAQFSVEAVARLKPAPEPYRHAAAELGVPIEGTRLVAAHAWDVTGAIRAGAKAAFVARPGMVLDPTGEAPDIVGTDLVEVADALLATR